MNTTQALLKWPTLPALTIGGFGLILANRDRVSSQDGVGANTVAKTVLTVAAVGATLCSGMLGAHLSAEDPDHVTSGTIPSSSTPDRTANRQQPLRILQWVIPLLTGAIIILGAQQGEQQKAGQVWMGKTNTVIEAGTRRLRY